MKLPTLTQYLDTMCKQYFTVLLLLTAVFEGKSQFKTTFYSNGKLKSEGCYSAKDTLKQGPWHFYYNTGKLNSEGSYYNGKMHGEWKYYSFNTATIEKTELWKDGIQEGEMREFHSNGKLAKSINYANGVYEGAFVAFYPNGKIKTKGLYKAGMPEGAWENFDEKGNIVVAPEPDKQEEQPKGRKRRKKRD